MNRFIAVIAAGSILSAGTFSGWKLNQYVNQEQIDSLMALSMQAIIAERDIVLRDAEKVRYDAHDLRQKAASLMRDAVAERDAMLREASVKATDSVRIVEAQKFEPRSIVVEPSDPVVANTLSSVHDMTTATPGAALVE